MANFAKLKNGKTVLKIFRVDDNDASTEADGVSFLRNLYTDPEGVWKQTSYNTYGNQHALGGTPFRKNFAMIGGTYDEDKDAFIPIKPPYASWTLNNDTCLWEAPVAEPSTTPLDNDGKQGAWVWQESSLSWIVVPDPVSS